MQQGATLAPGIVPGGEDGGVDRRSITGKELAETIRRGKPCNWDSCHISGDVDLKAVKIANSFVIRNALFTGTVDLRQARFERGADFTGCYFQRLILSDARVEGPLILNEVVIGEKVPDLIRIQLRQRSSRHHWQERFRKAKAERSGPAIAADFTNLRVAGCLSLMRSRLFGGLCCTHADIEDDLRIDETRINGDLKLRRAKLGELCTDGRGRIADAETTDPLPRKPFRISGQLDLTSATVGGDVRLIGVRIGGALTLQAAEIKGNLLCRTGEHSRGTQKVRFLSRLRSGAWLLGARIEGSVDFSGAEILGDVVLTNSRTAASARFVGCSVRGTVDLPGAHIGSEVSFAGAHLEGLTLQSASIGGHLFCTAATDRDKDVPCRIDKEAWLLGAIVKGEVNISGAWIGGNLVMQDMQIGLNLHAKIMNGFRTRIDGDLSLNGARISGAVEFAGSALHQKLILDHARIEGDLQVIFGFEDAPSWEIVRAHVGGEIHADSATIGKQVVLMGLDVGPTGQDGETPSLEAEAHVVDFSGAQVNGAFTLYSPDVAQDSLEALERSADQEVVPPQRRREILAQTREQRTLIGGDLLLTRAEVLGGVELTGSTIQGELRMQDANVRANITCRPLELEPPGALGRASVRKADLEGLDLAGKLDLTGLSIGSDLILRDSRIRGRLELYPSHDDGAQTGSGESPDARIAKIGGKLRLDASEVSQIVISGCSFGDPPKPESLKERMERNVGTAWKRRDYLLLMLLLRGGNPEEDTTAQNPADNPADIVLERATVGRLEIVQPLPGMLDLSNLTVGSWHQRADFFREMLYRSHPFKRSSYLAIENDLRNKGRDEEADKVHVWMRQRDRVNTRQLGRVLWDRLLDHSTKYGTTSSRLAWVMIIWFALSIWFFSDRQHVKYNVPPSSQVSENWSMGDAVFLAVRMHVPIVSLGIDEEIKPSGTGPKAWAVLAMAASWVMWPLFIASVSGFLRKRS